MATPLSLTLRLKALGNTALATAGLAAAALVPISTTLRLKGLRDPSS